MAFFKLILMNGLSYFHIIFGDWALAIIALAVAIRIVLLPLQIFNFVQQKRLRVIQPEIDRITSDFKADPIRAFKEIQSLKNKSGIKMWTTLLLGFAQLPIFLGMYQAISSTRNLVGTSFVWIPNLATPDAILILPLLVTAITYLQFKNKSVSTTENINSTAVIGTILPFINFVVMMAMPSSLVLYYAISGLFQLSADSILKNVFV